MFVATWTYVFPFDDDDVYFAYGVPYTYSRMHKALADVEA